MLECIKDGVYGPTDGRVHGTPDGAYSIWYDGSYPWETDEGETFWFTGETERSPDVRSFVRIF